MHDPTLQRAMEDMEQNRLPQAIASLRLRVRLKPRDAAAHTLLGSALQRAGDRMIGKPAGGSGVEAGVCRPDPALRIGITRRRTRIDQPLRRCRAHGDCG
jgi:hypothetical protein